jgi:hypothetical protein|tara:strand:+ start:5621 stop:6223 length:603 start_codon:yes stop_codon:yes gene_type:complete
MRKRNSKGQFLPGSSSDEERRKLSEAMKGKIPKNLESIQGWNRGKKMSEELREKMRQVRLGKSHSEETKRKMSIAHMGMKFSEAHRKKISLIRKGNKSPWWKGGITKERGRIYNSWEYQNWRKLVFTRDDYTCVQCQKRGGYLEADHIKPFSLYNELRFVVSNGRTLCKVCHMKTDTYGGKMMKYREDSSRSRRIGDNYS